MLTDVKHHDYMQNPHVGLSVIKQVKLDKTQTAKYSKLPEWIIQPKPVIIMASL